MAVLVSDHLQNWRPENKFERAVIKFLQTKISFKFRRGGDKRSGYRLPLVIGALLQPIARAD